MREVWKRRSSSKIARWQFLRRPPTRPKSAPRSWKNAIQSSSIVEQATMNIRLTHHGRIAIATLSRPPVNAIDDAMIADFHAILDDLERRKECQVLHVRSAQKVFAAGADLALIRSWKDAASPTAALSGYIERLQGLYRR